MNTTNAIGLICITLAVGFAAGWFRGRISAATDIERWGMFGNGKSLYVGHAAAPAPGEK